MDKVEITIVRMGFRCERCGHEWVPRKRAAVPKICPKCKSRYWDVPSHGAARIIPPREEQPLPDF